RLYPTAHLRRWRVLLGTTARRRSAIGRRGVVQHDTQERVVNLEAVVVVDEAELPELVHEEIHARSRRPDHFREDLLRDFWQHASRALRLAKTRQQEQRAGQPFFAGIEQLIDEVLLETAVPGEHVRDEAVGERMMWME